ncbi:hypothetical protein QJQ45_016673 [Haematococcus lacustris]|nr:hypothetical protein QJQ45_016673 [Haematococcus lacustris]
MLMAEGTGILWPTVGATWGSEPAQQQDLFPSEWAEQDFRLDDNWMLDADDARCIQDLVAELLPEPAAASDGQALLSEWAQPTMQETRSQAVKRPKAKRDEAAKSRRKAERKKAAMAEAELAMSQKLQELKRLEAQNSALKHRHSVLDRLVTMRTYQLDMMKLTPDPPSSAPPLPFSPPFLPPPSLTPPPLHSQVSLSLSSLGRSSLQQPGSSAYTASSAPPALTPSSSAASSLLLLAPPHPHHPGPGHLPGSSQSMASSEVTCSSSSGTGGDGLEAGAGGQQQGGQQQQQQQGGQQQQLDTGCCCAPSLPWGDGPPGLDSPLGALQPLLPPLTPADLARFRGLTALQFIARYKEHLAGLSHHLLALERPGPRSPAAESGLMQCMARAMFDLKHCSMQAPDTMQRVMATHLETGQEAAPPPQHWHQLLPSLALSPSQQQDCWELWGAYERLMSRVLTERAHINATLAAHGRSAPPSQALLSLNLPVECAVLESLMRNLRQEKSLALMLRGFMFAQVCTLLQSARMMVHSYPFFPNVTAIVAALVEDMRATGAAPDG